MSRGREPVVVPRHPDFDLEIESLRFHVLTHHGPAELEKSVAYGKDVAATLAANALRLFGSEASTDAGRAMLLAASQLLAFVDQKQAQYGMDFGARAALNILGWAGCDLMGIEP